MTHQERENGIGRLGWRKSKRKRDAGEIKRDILLTERNSVGLREGKVLLMLQREKSLGQQERIGDRIRKRLGLKLEWSAQETRRAGVRMTKYQAGAEGCFLFKK